MKATADVQIVVVENEEEVSVQISADVLEIRLSENGSTGHIWEIESDQTIIEDKRESKADPRAIGASYIRILRMAAPGHDEHMTVSLRLSRPFDKEVARRVVLRVRGVSSR